MLLDNLGLGPELAHSGVTVLVRIGSRLCENVTQIEICGKST